MYLAVEALEKGYADPRWGGYRQIQEAGGQVRKGEKGTPILYVEWRSRRALRDEAGQPVLDQEGRPERVWVERERPLVKLHHVFNVEQAEGLRLPSLAAPAPAWEGHERAEAVLRNSGVRIDHVAGDKACYRAADDRIVLPERSQFPSQSGYTHTALHELGHATGHPGRLNRDTLVKHDGFGSESYAREELRAEIAAMMAGERLGVGHEPRHGNAYVESWVKALRDDPREIRAAAVDAQRMADWMVARERERAPERPEPSRPAAAAPAGEAAARDAPALSDELRAVVRDAGAAGYRAGYAAAGQRLPPDPFESVRSLLPRDAGRELTFVVEQAHGDAYLRGMEDRQRGREAAPEAAVRRSAANRARRGEAPRGGAGGRPALRRRRGLRERLRRRRRGPREPPPPAGARSPRRRARRPRRAPPRGRRRAGLPPRLRRPDAGRRPGGGRGPARTRSTTSARRPRSGSGPRRRCATRRARTPPARTAADARERAPEREAGAEPLNPAGTGRAIRRPAGGDTMTDRPTRRVHDPRPGVRLLRAPARHGGGGGPLPGGLPPPDVLGPPRGRRRRGRPLAARGGPGPERRGAGRAVRGPRRLMWREASGPEPRGVDAAGRRERADARAPGADPAHRRLAVPGRRRGGAGHREGADRPRDPRGGPAVARRLRARELRRARRRAVRLGDVRPRPGGLHGRAPTSARACWRSRPGARSSSTRWRS